MNRSASGYTRITEGEIKKRFFIALDELFLNDGYLLEKGAHERSVAHKLAEYLRKQFPERHVDCEYDLHLGKGKKALEGLSYEPECEKDRTTDRFYPDIIIHVRGSDAVNDLVIEMKTKDRDVICDKKKLKLLTSDSGEFCYKLGLLLKFNRMSKPHFVWYKDGREQS